VKRAPRYDLPQAAPGPLRLVQLFVNTVNHETGRELLATPAQAASWFAEQGIALEVSRPQLERVRDVRSELQAFVQGEKPGERMREASQRARLILDLDRPELIPQADGVDGALGVLLASVYDAIRDGSWSRLKACQNCRWAFWDRSRSRTAVWCSMQLCGNRAKVRRYRARRRAKDEITRRS
jgi:predicted RNA-binding Zn ribbon-like protein